MLATERGSGSRWRPSAGPGRTPWPSTLPEAPGGSSSGLLSGGWTPGLAGGPGKERLRPRGPEDGGRPPPMARGVCSPAPPVTPGLERRREWKASETKRQKLASGLGTGNGSSSVQVPANKDTDMFVLLTAHLCLAKRLAGQITSACKTLKNRALCSRISLE